MRVVHVIDSIRPTTGGPAVIALSLAAAQARIGPTVEVVCGDSENEAARAAVQFQQIPSLDRVRLTALSSGARTPLFLPASLRAMGRRIGGASIVHLHGVWDPLLLLAAVQARRHRVPYFVLVNGMLDSWCLAQNALKKRVALSTLHGLLLRRAAAIHVNSEEERSRLRDLGLSVRTVVVANGVFVPTWLAARAPEPDRRSPVLLFLGRLHPKKGVDILIDAFAKLAWEHPSLQLVVAGPDEGVVRPAMEAVRKAQLGDRVAFPGPVFGEEKWRLLGRATCFCLPSRQEGFSMAVLEAMACGLPVVISDACHFQQVAAAGAGFVVPGEASHVAAALRRLLDNAALCRQMAANGQRLVTEQYTWSAVAGRLLEAYKNPSKKPG